MNILSSHANINNTSFDQRSPGPLEEGVLNCQRQRDIQTEMATLWLNQASGADSVEKHFKITQNAIAWLPSHKIFNGENVYDSENPILV